MLKIFFINLLLIAGTCFAQTQPALETVEYVDLSQYAGRWYQIAHNPMIFEGDCACAQQTLAPAANSLISVYNSCNDKTIDGPLREIRGFASIDDPKTNAKLTVDFNLPHKGAYWVIGLGQDYRYAVVSDPSRKSLYILSKTPELDPQLYFEAISRAAEQVDISALVMTAQKGCQYPK